MSEPIKVWAVAEDGLELCWWIRGPVERGWAESTVVADTGRVRTQHSGSHQNEPPSGYYLHREDARREAIARLKDRLAHVDETYKEMLRDAKGRAREALEKLERES